MRKIAPQNGIIMEISMVAKTKLTLENEFGTYSVETSYPCVGLSDVIESLMVPVLLAAGYSPENIKEVFNEP